MKRTIKDSLVCLALILSIMGLFILTAQLFRATKEERQEITINTIL